MFIECAVAHKCPYIISGDRHLLSVGNYMGIKIISPAEFLRKYFRNSTLQL